MIQLRWFIHTPRMDCAPGLLCASPQHLPTVGTWLIPICLLLPWCLLPPPLPVHVPHCAVIISSLVCCFHQAAGSVRAEAVLTAFAFQHSPDYNIMPPSLQDLVRYLLSKWNFLSFWSICVLEKPLRCGVENGSKQKDELGGSYSSPVMGGWYWKGDRELGRFKRYLDILFSINGLNH